MTNISADLPARALELDSTFPATDTPGVRELRVLFLDALRLIAGLAVVLQHYAEGSGNVGRHIASTLSPGVFGVVLFFQVSGFVIPMAAKNRFDWRVFAVKRLFRILPLVLATFLLLAILGYGTNLPLFDTDKIKPFDWVANILLIQDYVGASPIWGVTWTLSLEAAWYFLFAFSICFFGRPFFDRLPIIAPIVLVAAALFSVAIGHRLPLARPGLIYAAIIGCQFYRAVAGTISMRRMLVDLAIFVGVTAFDNVVSFGYFRHPNITAAQAIIPWILAAALFAIVALIPAVRNLTALKSRVVVWLAMLTFSIYMLHPLAWTVSVSMVPDIAVPFVAVALTILLSVASYYLVEAPGQRLGARLASRFGGK